MVGDDGDLRERVRELERANAELRRSNAELEEFAHVAAHDLQAPLSAISGFVDLLRKRYRGRLDADADEFIDFVVDGVAEMQRLVRGLLDWALVGEAELDRQEVDLHATLAGVLEDLGPVLEEKGARVHAHPLPKVWAEPGQVRQVLANLLSNALRFSPEEARVTVEAQPEGDGWRVSVRDHGLGVPEAERERVFEPLHRVHRERAGSGLGLAICRRVVERHGGRIWVEPAPGGGSVFAFTLPGAST